MKAGARLDTVYVWTDAFGPSRLVGKATVIPTGMQGRVAGEFAYAESYLGAPNGYSLDPVHLPRHPPRSTYETHTGLPAVLLDAGPDDWGRRVLGELEKPPATDIEVLLAARGIGVGALQFSLSRTSIKERDAGLSLADLEAAFQAAEQLERRQPLSENALRMLAAGATLGGARPKVPVTDKGIAWIAKFPSQRDAVNQPVIEHASLSLAQECGITAAESRLVEIDGRHTLLVRRFDAAQGHRLPYLSMFSAIVNGAPLSEQRAARDYGYPGLAEFLARFGARPQIDRPELFRRMCFNLLLGHVDDHDRNHGFLLRAGADNAWQLAPAFDVAPSNGEGLALAKRPVVQAIGLGTAGRERSLVNLFSNIGAFQIDFEQAVSLYREVQSQVAMWRECFTAWGVSEGDCERIKHRILASDIDWDRIPTEPKGRKKRS